MIVFGIKEEDEEGMIGDTEQRVVDRYNIEEILKDMNQSQLINKIVSLQRIGGKTDEKIRPIRVEFQSAMDRETACRNAYQLKNSDRFRYTASIRRDKIREDRELERAQYLENKRRKNTINELGQPGSQIM